MKSRCVGETMGEDNIVEVRFEEINKDIPIELWKYIRANAVEASRRKVPFNSWSIKVIKDNTRSIRCLYRVKSVDMVYRIEMARRERKKYLKINQRFQEPSR